MSGNVELLNLPNNSNIEVYKDFSQKEMPNFNNKLDLLINPILHNALTRVTMELMSCEVPVMMYNFKKR